MWCSDVTTQGLKTKQQIQLWMQWSTSQNLKKKELRHHSMRLFSYGVQNIAQRIYLGVYLCLYIVVHV